MSKSKHGKRFGVRRDPEFRRLLRDWMKSGGKCALDGKGGGQLIIHRKYWPKRSELK